VRHNNWREKGQSRGKTAGPSTKFCLLHFSRTLLHLESRLPPRTHSPRLAICGRRLLFIRFLRSKSHSNLGSPALGSLLSPRGHTGVMEGRRSATLGVSITFFVLASIFVALRFISRIFVVRKIGLHDWLMLVAWVCGILRPSSCMIPGMES
jgi:hypothetical protein